LLPVGQGADDAQVPPALHVSSVQALPSLHCELSQHSRQLLPQSLGVAGAQLHVEFAQIAPALQAVGQLPQCAALLRKSTSQPSPGKPLQLPKSARHFAAPATQVSFGPTARPHAPQLLGSLLRFTQETPPHSVSPLAQPLTHWLPLQTGVPPSQRWLHAPQCSGLVFGLSQPAAASQFEKSFAQPHAPLLHVEFAPQSSAQLPHVFGSASEASQPSSALPLQSAKPGSHTQRLASQR
jgi:hypothetical protein